MFDPPVFMVSKHSVTTRLFFFLHKKWYQSVQQNRSFILNTHITTRDPPPNPILSLNFPCTHLPCSAHTPLLSEITIPVLFAAIILSLIKSVSYFKPSSSQRKYIKKQTNTIQQASASAVRAFHKTPPPSPLFWITVSACLPCFCCCCLCSCWYIPEFSMHTGPVHVCMCSFFSV